MHALAAATRETTTLKNRREAASVAAGVAGFGFSAAPGQRLCYLVARGDVMRLVADAMLGRPAKRLRVLGYDTLYWLGDDAGLLRLAVAEDRQTR